MYKYKIFPLQIPAAGAGFALLEGRPSPAWACQRCLGYCRVGRARYMSWIGMNWLIVRQILQWVGDDTSYTFKYVHEVKIYCIYICIYVYLTYQSWTSHHQLIYMLLMLVGETHFLSWKIKEHCMLSKSNRKGSFRVLRHRWLRSNESNPCIQRFGWDSKFIGWDLYNFIFEPTKTLGMKHGTAGSRRTASVKLIMAVSNQN